MTKSDELHKNDYSENAVEIHQLQAPNRTSRKDEVSNIKHDLMYSIILCVLVFAAMRREFNFKM